LLHQVGNLFELNVKLRCQKVNDVTYEVAKEARCTPQKYSVRIEGSIVMEKKPGHEADHLPPSNVEVKNEWS
jgi:hypothetical protein